MRARSLWFSGAGPFVNITYSSFYHGKHHLRGFHQVRAAVHTAFLYVFVSRNHMTEEQAHSHIQKLAMDSRRRQREVAEDILHTYSAIN